MNIDCVLRVRFSHYLCCDFNRVVENMLINENPAMGINEPKVNIKSNS